jgi:hypothetical protein
MLLLPEHDPPGCAHARQTPELATSHTSPEQHAPGVQQSPVERHAPPSPPPDDAPSIASERPASPPLPLPLPLLPPMRS